MNTTRTLGIASMVWCFGAGMFVGGWMSKTTAILTGLAVTITTIAFIWGMLLTDTKDSENKL